MIIAAGPNSWLSQRIFGNKAVVFIGLISYPLYLWHWPIISFLTIVSNGQPSTISKIVGLLTTFILSVITYWVIERPIRASREEGLFAAVLLSLVLCMGAVGFAMHKKYIEPRLESISSLKPIMTALNDWNFPDENASIQGEKSGEIVFIGDSFLQQYYSRVKKITKDSRRSPVIRFLGIGGCPPLPGISRIADPGGCLIKNTEAFLEAKKKDVTKVVFGSAWHYFYPINERSKQLDSATFEHEAKIYREADTSKRGIEVGSDQFKAVFQSFEEIVSALINDGKEVYIVLPSPISDQFDPRLMIDRIHGQLNHDIQGIAKTEYIKDFAPILQALRGIANRSGAILLDPTTELCAGNFCRAFQGEMPIYNDIGHIRPYFSENYITLFDKIILD